MSSSLPKIPAAYDDVTIGAYFADVQYTAKPNVPLLNAVIEHIEANPNDWYQGDWRTLRTFLRDDQGIPVPLPAADCGTAMCFAGWAAQLSGAEYAYPAGDGELHDDVIVSDGTDSVEAAHIVRTDEGLVHVQDYATRALGIDEGQSNRLFHGANTLADLKRHVARIIEQGRIEQANRDIAEAEEAQDHAEAER